MRSDETAVHPQLAISAVLKEPEHMFSAQSISLDAVANSIVPSG